jgi:hypothetical protein
MSPVRLGVKLQRVRSGKVPVGLDAGWNRRVLLVSATQHRDIVRGNIAVDSADARDL